MHALESFRTDAPVTPEQWKYIDERIKVLARRTLIGRRLMPVYGPLGFGKEAVAYDKMTEMSDALLNLAWKVDASEDIVNLTRTTLPIAVISKGFRINARSLAASRTYGTPLDTQNLDSAIYKVAKLEDDLILDGYAADGSNYDIKGLYQANISNKVTGSQWTGAPEDAIGDVADLIATMMGNDIGPPYNLVLHPTQYAELLNVGASTHTEAIVFDTVQRQLGGGRIYWTTALTDGTGMLVAAGSRGYFDLAIGIDMQAEIEQLSLREGRDLFGLVYETLVPRIWETDAILAIDTI